ncbi:MAG: FxsA family protein [Planctomycetaceae bacterium]|jgi:UPF0716 protein FxsA|nr:FxsA family protein [Planctomycetaceae bacterium]
MFPYIALAIVTLPVIELLSLYLMWWGMGVIAMALWIILTGFCGIIFAKSQGMRYWHRINAELDKGEQPTDSVLHDLLIVFAGFALVLPGLFTDIIGFALFLPPVRNRVINRIKKTFTMYRKKSQSSASASETVNSANEYNAREDVIDA